MDFRLKGRDLGSGRVGYGCMWDLKKDGLRQFSACLFVCLLVCLLEKRIGVCDFEELSHDYCVNAVRKR